jgi:hypothetical protein
VCSTAVIYDDLQIRAAVSPDRKTTCCGNVRRSGRVSAIEHQDAAARSVLITELAMAAGISCGGVCWK